MKTPCIAALAATLICLSGLPSRGDTVELSNGDVIKGKVLSLDASQLRLQSEVHGSMTIARDKVAVIALGDKPPVAKTAQAKQAAAGSIEDVVKQLQAEGIDQGQMGELKKAFPLLATPEASGYFNEMVGGLMSGSRSVGDIRKDAIRVRDELESLKRELGPDAATALNGYLGILENFIRETEPKSEKKQE